MKLFADIIKTDDEKRMVYGYASTEALDSQGEIVRKDAIEAALPDYMRWGNVREMHKASAVGVAKEATMDENGLYLSAKVVDDSAWTKVKEGVYKGFSIGGKALEKAEGIVAKLKLTEISLVDRPANPECVFDVFKADLENDLEDPPAEPNDDPGDDGKIDKREFDTEERDKAADKGAAMPDGSFPILNKQDLRNAIHAYGRAKDKEAAKRHIIKRAKALGATDLLPEDWTKAEEPIDLAKFMGAEAWDASRAIDALNTIYDLIRRETEEGDQGQLANLMTVVSNLKQFIASEIAEPPEDAKGEPMELVDQPTDLEKAGARNSKSDQDRIQAMHDHTAALGATCGSTTKAASSDDLQKVELAERLEKLESAYDTIAKLTLENDDMAERIKKLEAEPETPRIRKMQVPVSKEADAGGQARLQVGEEIDIIMKSDLPPIEKSARILKLQRSITN